MKASKDKLDRESKTLDLGFSKFYNLKRLDENLENLEAENSIRNFPYHGSVETLTPSDIIRKDQELNKINPNINKNSEFKSKIMEIHKNIPQIPKIEQPFPNLIINNSELTKQLENISEVKQHDIPITKPKVKPNAFLNIRERNKSEKNFIENKISSKKFSNENKIQSKKETNENILDSMDDDEMFNEDNLKDENTTKSQINEAKNIVDNILNITKKDKKVTENKQQNLKLNSHKKPIVHNNEDDDDMSEEGLEEAYLD